MKYLKIFSIMVVGLIVGKLIAPLITPSDGVQLAIIIGFGVVGAFIGKFIHSVGMKATPARSPSMDEVERAMVNMGFTRPDADDGDDEIDKKNKRIDELLPIVEQLRQKLAKLAPNSEEHERVTHEFLSLKEEHNALRYEVRGEYKPNYTITMNNTSFIHYNPRCDPESEHYDPSTPPSRKMHREGSIYFK